MVIAYVVLIRLFRCTLFIQIVKVSKPDLQGEKQEIQSESITTDTES